MRHLILAGLLALVPGLAMADAALDKKTHNACEAHRNFEITAKGRPRLLPGYQGGWEKCAAFEVTYRAALAAAAAAAITTMQSSATARDAAAQGRLDQ